MEELEDNPLNKQVDEDDHNVDEGDDAVGWSCILGHQGQETFQFKESHPQ